MKKNQIQLREMVEKGPENLNKEYKKNNTKLLSYIDNSFEEWKFIYEHSTRELEKLALQKMREHMKK